MAPILLFIDSINSLKIVLKYSAKLLLSKDNNKLVCLHQLFTLSFHI